METMKAKEVTIKSDDVEVVLHDCDIIIEDESSDDNSNEAPPQATLKDCLREWAKAGLYLVLCILGIIVLIALWYHILS